MNCSVVAGITTKNEEWIIDKTLHAVTQFCDKVIVYDDGSTDKTEEICRSYNKVIWKVRPSHNSLDRQEAQQRLELINFMGPLDPDYVLLLDADEIPTPEIVNFIDIALATPQDLPPHPEGKVYTSQDINLWSAKMVNLWGDESSYRCDSYKTYFDTDVRWDPFIPGSWKKHCLMKYNKNKKYEYNLKVQTGGTSKLHPCPKNIEQPICHQDNFLIMHYGKLSSSYLNGDVLKYYAKIQSKAGDQSYEERIAWHIEHNRIDTLKTRSTSKEWFWKDKIWYY
jgi:glycosyltransferase involved in cell wall biosynthesis